MRQGVGCVGRLVQGACLVRQGSWQEGAPRSLPSCAPCATPRPSPPSGDTTQEDHGHPVLDRDKATPNATPRRWFAWLK